MNKGAVPIPYIIALLLGIAVVAILGYWFFVLSGLWGGEATLATCRTNAHTYCAGWQTVAYAYDSDSGRPNVGWFSEMNPQCDSHKDTIGFSVCDYQDDGCDTSDAEDDKAACQSILTT